MKPLIIKLISLMLILAVSCNPKKEQNNSNQKWWKEAVVYQIYPRSFQDSDGDGVGDLKGIIERLDYIKSLGIDVVWLNPIYSSPNDDMGYDISDYRNIMKEMGTMEDFDALLKGMHERGIKLVMDLVVNHCSDEHDWFKQSRSSRDNPYRNYFHWWPAEKGKPAARWSFFDEEGNAWRYDSTTKAYYLHYFSRKQPDLNWENKKVRQEVYDLMKFWFEKGIDGFRMDVIPFISKDTTFPELPKEYNGNFVNYYANGPKLHEYLHEMNQEVLSKYDIMTVGEGAGVQREDALKYVNEDRRELQTFYHFDHVGWGKRKDNGRYPDPNNRHLPDLKSVFTRWDSTFKEKGWGTVYFTTHDQSRMQSRFGDDKVYKNESSKMLYTLLLTQRATPYLYWGDEIGMSNIRFTSVDQYKDIETINYYNYLKKTGGDTEAFLKGQQELGRDNSRTPMQWNSKTNGGFTKGKPWLQVNPDFSKINAEAAEKDPNSILHFMRKMIKLRKDNKEILVYGKYTELDKDNTKVYAYTREAANGKKVLVLLNFSKETAKTNTGLDLSNAKVMIGNYPIAAKDGTLKPFEAVVLELN